MKPAYGYCCLIIIVAAFIACNRAHNKSEIETALKTYDRLVKKIDADSIALLYAADGDLGEMAHGRDSIRKFLASFKNVSVLYAASTSDTLQLNGDTALQSGHYDQIDVIDHKDTVRPKGTFTAKWVWIQGEGWRIKKMTTHSEN